MQTSLFTRRTLILGGVHIGAAMLVLARSSQAADPLPKMIVTRDPTCSCCGGWVAHMKAAGFRSRSSKQATWHHSRPSSAYRRHSLPVTRRRSTTMSSKVTCPPMRSSGCSPNGLRPPGLPSRACRWARPEWNRQAESRTITRSLSLDRVSRWLSHAITGRERSRRRRFHDPGQVISHSERRATEQSVATGIGRTAPTRQGALPPGLRDGHHRWHLE
jgi:hypothetical protein